MDGTARTVASHYDLAGRRTAITGDAGYHAGFSYDGTSRLTAYAEGGTNIVVRLGYNGVGLRSSLSFGAVPSSSTGYGYDGAARLASLGHDLAGTGADQARTFGYNAASQIVTRTGSNDAYAANAPAGAAAYSVNGLNQYVAVGGTAHGYDANGNLTSDGSTTYVYDSENRRVSASGARNATLSYDPLGRLWQVSGANGTTRFLYDGDRLIQEYGGSGNVLRTYVHGTGTDEPLVWYDYVGGFSRRFLHADERGSIVAVADENGNALAINRYDEYGVPAAGNLGRFSYTGQTWIPELGLYYYKARFYSPALGRFMQIDLVGYEDQWNLYAYVRNDPVNLADPSGMSCEGGPTGRCRIDRAARVEGSGTNSRVTGFRPLTPAEQSRASRFEANYTRAYQKLQAHPDRVVRVDGFGRRNSQGAFRTTAREMAAEMRSRDVIFVASGGPTGVDMATLGGLGRGEIPRTLVFDNALTRPSGEVDIVHEMGLHGTEAEAAGGLQVQNSPLGNTLERAHQRPYQKAACDALGGDCRPWE